MYYLVINSNYHKCAATCKHFLDTEIILHCEQMGQWMINFPRLALEIGALNKYHAVTTTGTIIALN